MMPQNLQLSEEQLKAKAIECDRVLTRGLFEKLFMLKEMHDDKLYLYLNQNYSSMEEYCQDKFDFARSTTYGYLQVAVKFLAILEDKSDVQRAGLIAIGIEKLKILSSLYQSQLSELVVSGVLKLGEKTYTIQDIKLMDRDALKSIITGKEVEESEEKETDIPFNKVYDRVERYFTHVLNNVFNCPTILEPDQIKIELAIKEAIKVFDYYKSLEEGDKKIK